jgi:hypothetical protein
VRNPEIERGWWASTRIQGLNIHVHEEPTEAVRAPP